MASARTVAPAAASAISTTATGIRCATAPLHAQHQQQQRRAWRLRLLKPEAPQQIQQEAAQRQARLQPASESRRAAEDLSPAKQPQQQRQAGRKADKIDGGKHMPQLRMSQPRQQVSRTQHADAVLRRRKAAAGQQRFPLAATLMEGTAVVPVIEECVTAGDQKDDPDQKAPKPLGAGLESGIEGSVHSVCRASFRPSCYRGRIRRLTPAHLRLDLREDRQFRHVVEHHEGARTPPAPRTRPGRCAL